MNRRNVFVNLAVSLGAVLLISGSGQSDYKPGEVAKGASFKTLEGYELTLGEMETRSEVDLADERKSEYSVELIGTIKAPEKVDAVGVLEEFRVKSVYDNDKKDLFGRRRQAPRYSDDYNAFHDRIAPVEVEKTEIVRDAWTIQRMELATQVILAEKRSEHVLPAVVMEDYKQIAPGLKVRITSLRMSDDRKLTVRGSYKRIAEGPHKPFVEALYCLNDDKEVLGGGRWTKGDPTGSSGSLTWSFQLRRRQVHRDIRVVMVTECETQELRFNLKDIFQR